MKPKIIVHTQTSLDGRIKGFEDTGIYYRVSYQFNADMVLFGSNTVLAAAEFFSPPEKESDFIKPIIVTGDSRPLAVVADSRGVLRNLHLFRNMEYLKDVIVLVSETTPESYLDYLKERHYDFIVAGTDHVDYQKAFEILYTSYNCRIVRTDSGGTLTNILLEQGLVDEISLVVSPCLVGNQVPNMFESLTLQDSIRLELIQRETMDDNYLSLIYRVIK